MDTKNSFLVKLIFMLNGFLLKYKISKDIIFSSLDKKLKFKIFILLSLFLDSK